MKKVDIFKILIAGFFTVGCGGGGDSTTQNILNTNKKLSSLPTSNLKGHRITIEYMEPLNYELYFLCSGGYKLSLELDEDKADEYTKYIYKEPIIQAEFVNNMYHIESDSIVFDSVYPDKSIWNNRYVLLTNEDKIEVNKSSFSDLSVFNRKVKEIKQFAICK